jgi:hypothetical protein
MPRVILCVVVCISLLVCLQPGLAAPKTKPPKTPAKPRTAMSKEALFPGLSGLKNKVDVANDAAVTRELATLMSFAYYSEKGQVPTPISERLYIPYRSKQYTGLQPGFADATKLLLARHEQLQKTPGTNLAAAASARLLFHERLKIAAFNQRFGNTPDSSFEQFGRYLGNAFEKLNALEEQLERDKDAVAQKKASLPLSMESLVRAVELQKALSVESLKDQLTTPAAVSGYLAYADMAAVDRESDFWSSTLLPLATQNAGAESSTPLVTVTGHWGKRIGPTTQVLDHIGLRSAAPKKMTHVVVELIAENEWGDSAAHYYYFNQLLPREYLRLVPHPRWQKRRLPFTNTINVKYSVWTDEGREIGQTVKLTNPVPISDAKAARQDFLRQDKEHAAFGELFGLAVAAADILN